MDMKTEKEENYVFKCEYVTRLLVRWQLGNLKIFIIRQQYVHAVVFSFKLCCITSIE
jgi:hypothetical protein